MKKKEFIVSTIIIILIVLLLTANLFYIKYNNYKSLSNLETGINISIKLSDLVHELQKERGMSSGYLSSNATKFKQELIQQRKITDQKIKNYKNSINKNLEKTLPQNLIVALKNSDFYIKRLFTVRDKIDKQQITAKTSIDEYSNIDDHLLSPMIAISKRYKLAILSTYMMAYTNFLHAKEQAGIERAVGTRIILSHNITQQDINHYNSIIVRQQLYYKLFKQYASKQFLKRYNNLSDNYLFKNVNTYRDIILSGNTKQINNIDVQDWFSKITNKINKLEELENFLSDEILIIIQSQRHTAWISLLQFIVYTITGLMIILLILYFIINLIIRKAKLEDMVDKHIILSTSTPTGIITNVSSAFCEASGYTKDELIGKPHNIIRHPDMPKELFANLWSTIQSGKIWNGIIKNRAKDGKAYIVDAHIEPIFGYKNKIIGYIAIRHNITDTEQLKEQMKQNAIQHQHMVHQSRLAQMGEMISMIAHQWRQPLSAISATSSTIQLRADMEQLDKNTILKLSSKINTYVEHLSTTIDDFRNFFKQNKTKKITTIEEIINSTLDIIQVSLENKNISLIKNIKDSTECNTYVNEVKQVLLNIIKNAEDVLLEVKPNNPTITIEVPQVTRYSSITIIIKDNAGGVPEDIIDKIFDPYFSTKLSKNGTGLGLYMSKTIIEENCKGRLSVYNDKDGAVFTIELPK